jgi:hypothetical protein
METVCGTCGREQLSLSTCMRCGSPRTIPKAFAQKMFRPDLRANFAPRREVFDSEEDIQHEAIARLAERVEQLEQLIAVAAPEEWASWAKEGYAEDGEDGHALAARWTEEANRLGLLTGDLARAKPGENT